MNDNRGSKWRKWDLHFHTPSSYDYEDKSVTDQQIIDGLIANNISVIAITDHHVIDTARIRSLQSIGEGKIVVLPGIEFRADLGGSDSIHFIGIFSEKSDIEDIWIKLQSGCRITTADIEKKGGDKNINCDFKDTCKLIHDLGGIVTVHAGSKTNTVENITNSLPYKMALKTDLLTNHLDVLELGKTEDQDDYNNIVFPAISRRLPMIICSDNHNIKKYIVKQNLWIKADPTFEGLKQILYEPEQRVKIQQEKPDFKEDKLIIDQVWFISSNNKFTPHPICLSENLNVIIGGKSSGKSILLYSIAKTLLADRDFFTKEGIHDKYKFESHGFDFIIKTKGGFEQTIHRKENENSLISDIKYIPQNYLVKLAESEINKSGDSLNKIIRELIKEDENAKNSYDVFIAAVKSNDRKRESIIDTYFEIKARIIDLEAQLKLKPKVEILESNIATNTTKVEELNRSTGMSPEQISEYNELQKKLEQIQAERTVAGEDFKKIEKHNAEVLDILKNLKIKHNLFFNSLRNENLKALYSSANSELESLLVAFNTIASKIETVPTESGRTFKSQNEVSQVFTDLTTRKKEIDIQIEPYLKNDAIKKQIEDLSKSINEDKVSLQTITQLAKEISDSKKSLAEEKEKLFLQYEANLQEYNTVVTQLKIRTNELEKDDGLKITGQIKFNFPKFRREFLKTNDGRKRSYEDYDICNDDRNSLHNYSLAEIISELKSIFEGIVETGDYVLKGDDKKNPIKLLLDDYFFDYWLIEYKNDKLGEMSTGKASFVILMLIVGLSKSKAPILIDQPEDNLDNRSITTDLVTYLRNKKTERQIILVTHNPNVVVNADAENIIVANQKNQNDTQSSSPYHFDYINGAIENTFTKNDAEHDLLKSMGIREHIAEIVEGGKEAFKKREEKYGF